MRVAAEHRVPWWPGAGSGTQGGSVPVHGGLVIDLTGLDRIVEIDERSYTVTCEAGVNGDRLERELNARGSCFPTTRPRRSGLPSAATWPRAAPACSPPATARSRPAAVAAVVLANGELIETVPVPRHAVGPELTQLFVGSEGTLGSSRR